jgi:hypothetical protein
MSANSDYQYKSGDEVEVEIFRNHWIPGVFQSYVPVSLKENHYYNISLNTGDGKYKIQSAPEKVRKIKWKRRK